MPNIALSRRNLLTRFATAAAAVPVVALPTLAEEVPIKSQPPAPPIVPALEAAPAPATDARLLTLAKDLKVAWAKVDKLEPRSRKLHEAAWEASGFSELGDDRTDEQQKEAEQRLHATMDENGYHGAYKKWNTAASKRHRIARAILKIPSNDQIGDGIRAAAEIVENGDVYAEESPMLWGMAARAGFVPPPEIAKQLKRMGVRPAASRKVPADPAFAAVERYRKTWQAHGDAIGDLCKYEDNNRTADGHLPNDRRARQLERRANRIGDANSAAVMQLCRTVPTTHAGLAAMLKLVEERPEILRHRLTERVPTNGEPFITTERVFLASVRQSSEQLA